MEEDGKISLPKPEKDETVVARLFGISSDTETRPARLQFRDAFIKEESRNKFKNLDTDTYLGEIKAENTINRGSGVANPRIIERVPAGMEFDFQLVYNIEDESQMEKDMEQEQLLIG